MWKCGRCEIQNQEKAELCVVCGFSRAESQAYYLRIAAQRQATQPRPEPATAPENVPESAEVLSAYSESGPATEKKSETEKSAPAPVLKVHKERKVGKIVGIILACLALAALTACIVGVIYLAMDSETEQTMQQFAIETEGRMYNVLSKMRQ